MKNKICFQLMIIISILISINCCKKDDEKSQPSEEIITVVTTISASSMTTTSVICGGIVTDDDSLSIIERGVCYSTSQNPTIDNTKILSAGQNGKFDCNLTGLTINGTYYVKAYTKKNSGITYGNEIKFTTDPLNVSDNDGNTYNVIRIGTQLWMKENLRTTKYQDGTSIPNNSSDVSWVNQKNGAYCWYYNYIPNKDKYGALYNYIAVVDARNICPKGWHIPTDAEWSILIKYIGGLNNANKLKDSTLWQQNNLNDNNSTGFSALPSGRRVIFLNTSFNDDVRFEYIGTLTNFWSYNWYDETNAWAYSIVSTNIIYRYYECKWNGYSVRCIRD